MRLFIWCAIIYCLSIGCKADEKPTRQNISWIPDSIYHFDQSIYFIGGSPIINTPESSGLNFIQRIQQNAYLNQWPYKIINSGILGENSHHLLERCQIINWNKETKIVILEVGWDDFDQEMDPEITINNVRMILDFLLQKDISKIYLLYIPHPQQAASSTVAIQSELKTVTESNAVELLLPDRTAQKSWFSTQKKPLEGSEWEDYLMEFIIRDLRKEVDDIF